MSMQSASGTDTAREGFGRELNKLLGKYADSDLARRIARMVNPVYRKGQKLKLNRSLVSSDIQRLIP